jgi:hypothetical protein
VDIGGRAIAEYRLIADRPEFIIRPNVEHIQTLDRVDVREVARLGDEAVEASLPDLKQSLSWPARLRRTLINR